MAARLLALCALLLTVPLGAPSAIAPTSGIVSTAAAAGTPVSFVASAASPRNTASPWVTIPSGVVSGDRLLLVVSVSSVDRQASLPVGGSGWTLEGDQTARSMRTFLWSTVATASDAGTRITIPLSGKAKSTVQVAAYRGTTGPVVVTSAAGTSTGTARRTPVVGVSENAWVASYWAGKSASATSWTPPGSVAARGGSAANTGSGRIVSLLADSAQPLPAGNDGGLTATSDASTTAATMWSVVLSAGGDQPPPTGTVEVPAKRETDPVGHSGDSADDPAIWVDTAHPAESLVIGNDKLGALEVYGLDGTRVQRITTGTSFWGNVDVRQGVDVGGRTRDVVVAYNAGLRTFEVDPVTRQLTPIGDGTGAVPTSGGEGLCAYHSESGELYVFVITRGGRLREYRIHDSDNDGLLQGTMVREFQVGSEAEGCVADDATGRLYVSEEDVGLWRYGAEPGDGSTRVLVDAVAPDGHLAYDVEGVTLVTTGAASGYLIVSAQNGAEPSRSYFAVYDRQTNAYLWSFRIVAGAGADGCERTDGIAAYAGDLGPDFPAGLFVCQDNGNTAPGAGNQDFKFTGLDAVLASGGR